MTKFLTALLLSLVLAFSAYADRRRVLIDSIQAQLANLTTASDSLHSYLNILDLSAADMGARIETTRKICEVAAHAGDTVAIIESLTYQANAAMGDSVMLKEIRSRLKSIPPSARRKEAELFVDMLLARNRLKYGSDDDTKELPEVMQRSLSTVSEDFYPRLLSLYSACVSLSNHTTGALLEEYIEILVSLVDKMNLPMGSVRNLVYNTAAIIYAGNNNPDKAVEMNKRLLNIVDSLTDSYARQGRIYRTLDRNRYLFYRRMLINFSALTPAEIESYHRAIHLLAKENDDIKADIEENPLVHACYLHATGKYAEAIEAFEKAAAVKSNDYFLYAIYSNIYEAAEKSGNKAEQLNALQRLNSLLRNQLENKEEEHYRELKIMYDVNELKARTFESEEERRAASSRANRIVVFITATAIILLVFFLIILLSRNRKMRKLGDKLKAVADSLRGERNELRSTQNALIEARDMAKGADRAKAEFINNITHEIKTPLLAIAEYSRLIVDCIPEEQRKYLEKYADIIELNSKLVLTLVDDLLDASSLEHGDMSVSVENVSVHTLCDVAIGSLFEKMKTGNPDVRIIFNPSGKPDMSINTDGKRVVQILMNLLSNAAKFTERGKITVDYDCDYKEKNITFSVTDTGCGIPGGKEEEIFTRFNRCNPNNPGMGLGLYISRLLARLLKGTLTVDTTYNDGARFLLTIPM